MGSSWPLTCIAKDGASPPIASAARREPWASSSPKPLRSAMRTTSSSTASAFPKRSSRPSVSPGPMRPCSKHSMAKAIVPAAEMTSRPSSLHSSLARATACRSPIAQSDPKPATASYSGPSYMSVTVWRSLNAISGLQRTAQA